MAFLLPLLPLIPEAIDVAAVGLGELFGFGAMEAGVAEAGAAEVGAVEAGAVEAGAVEAGAVEAGAVEAVAEDDTIGGLDGAALSRFNNGEPKMPEIINTGKPNAKLAPVGVAESRHGIELNNADMLAAAQAEELAPAQIEEVEEVEVSEVVSLTSTEAEDFTWLRSDHPRKLYTNHDAFTRLRRMFSDLESRTMSDYRLKELFGDVAYPTKPGKSNKILASESLAYLIGGGAFVAWIADTKDHTRRAIADAALAGRIWPSHAHKTLDAIANGDLEPSSRLALGLEPGRTTGMAAVVAAIMPLLPGGRRRSSRYRRSNHRTPHPAIVMLNDTRLDSDVVDQLRVLHIHHPSDQPMPAHGLLTQGHRNGSSFNQNGFATGCMSFPLPNITEPVSGCYFSVDENKVDPDELAAFDLLRNAIFWRNERFHRELVDRRRI